MLGKKKLSSPVGISFTESMDSNHCLVPPPSLDALDDDVVLVDLKLQQKKLNVKKHRVLTEMQNELMVLIQSAESELDKNLDDGN